MRSFPRTPVAQMLTLAGILACLVTLFVSTIAGFVLLVVALVVAVALRILGLR
jgi:hypothetical protein